LREYAAPPTGLDFILGFGSTKMSRLRRWISFWDVNPARYAALRMNCPGGTFENNPAFQHLDVFAIGRVREGRLNPRQRNRSSRRDFGGFTPGSRLFSARLSETEYQRRIAMYILKSASKSRFGRAKLLGLYIFCSALAVCWS
jgi:hypothetical protein